MMISQAWVGRIMKSILQGASTLVKQEEVSCGTNCNFSFASSTASKRTMHIVISKQKNLSVGLTAGQKTRGRGPQTFLSRSHATTNSQAASQAFANTQARYRAGTIRMTLFCTGLSASIFTMAAFREESMLRIEWQNWKERRIFGELALPEWIERAPTLIQNFYREFWQDLDAAQKGVATIIALNGLVFLAMNSRSSKLLAFMDRNFVHSLPPLPNRLITLLTSNFTHRGSVHFAFNMIALWSFGVTAARELGVNQFLAFYLTSGLSAALLSDLGRFRSLRGGRSLGASGAVYACFALAALTKPDIEVVLIFLPMLPFNIADGLSAMIAFDIVGACLGWRAFDHFGHLGGALFGVYYAVRGYKDLWPRFQSFADKLLERSDEEL